MISYLKLNNSIMHNVLQLKLHLAMHCMYFIRFLLYLFYFILIVLVLLYSHEDCHTQVQILVYVKSVGYNLEV